MTIEFLVSTINRSNLDFLKPMFYNLDFENLNILVINQCIDIELVENIKPLHDKIRVISVKEKGISKSRNLAIKNALGDICVIADDDISYEKGSIENIKKAYEKHSQYEILTFLRKEMQQGHTFFKHHRLSILTVSSLQITFKRKTIQKNNLLFNESFGIGSGIYIGGEEPLFLNDCLNKGIPMGRYPYTIVSHPHLSTGKKMNLAVFITYGATVSKIFGTPMGIAMLTWFVIKKTPQLYKKENVFKVLYCSIKNILCSEKY